MTVGFIASQIARHYQESAVNSGVYEIEWEGFSDGERPVDWRFVGDAADARYGCLLGQLGYIQVSTGRGDIIAGIISAKSGSTR